MIEFEVVENTDKAFCTVDCCMLGVNNEISDQNKDVIKVSLIFCEG